MKYCVAAVVTALTVLVCGCGQDDAVRSMPVDGGPWPCLLVSQAQFVYETSDGKSLPVPGPALVCLLQQTDRGWRESVLEDPDSNVCHKALFVRDGGVQKLLTIGATRAALKLWRLTAEGWQAELLWQPTFGGTWDRLRDVEVADVNGDGNDDIVLATHDQGVVAVASRGPRGWTVREIDRAADTFVHEIEIGDVNGDGTAEIFATPSKPNKASGGPQPGMIVMYRWNGTAFDRTVVDQAVKTHAKEILVAPLGPDGRPVLFGVFEAETRRQGQQLQRVTPVSIRQYAFGADGISSRQVATLDDYQCRFLCAGDVDGDGRAELVAAGMKSGLWLLRPGADGWSRQQIAADSSGYEHATVLADLDADGRDEIYVAADDQLELRRFVWNRQGFARTVIGPIGKNRITWNITTGAL